MEKIIQAVKTKTVNGCQLKMAIFNLLLEIVESDKIYRIDFNNMAFKGLSSIRNVNFIERYDELVKMNVLDIYDDGVLLNTVFYVQFNKLGLVSLDGIKMELNGLKEYDGMVISTETHDQSKIDDIVQANKEILYINFTKITQDNILTEVGPKDALVFYIDKSYSTIALSKCFYESACDSFWGLNPLITISGGQSFKNQDEANVYYWSLLALECKAVLISPEKGPISLSKVIDFKIGKTFAAINVEEEEKSR